MFTNNEHIAWMSIIILSSASCQNSQTTNGDLCYSKNIEGTCVDILSCDYVVDLIQQGKYDEARTMFCGHKNKTVHVCCPKVSPVIVFNETEPASTNKPKPLTTPKPVSKETEPASTNKPKPLNTTKTFNRETEPESTKTVTIESITPQMDLFPNRSVCGQFVEQDRIIGGQIAGMDEFPWLVRLKYIHMGKEQYGCAGSLITNRHVLTAAHCLRNSSKLLSVRLGEFDASTEQDCMETENREECNDKPIDVLVKSVIIHPGYKDTPYIVNDIGLLTLAQDVNFTDFIQPVCLPTTEYTAAQDYLSESKYMTAGWGATEYDTHSDVKRKVMLQAVSIDICQAVYMSKISWRSLICAGGKKFQDSCGGDSGGSLVREVSENNGLNWYLYGITSFGGNTCGKEGVPGVYTRVTVFMDWIREQVART